MNEETAIACFIRGDHASFAYYFKLHYGPLCGFANSLVSNKKEAEDIAKESFTKLWLKHADFFTSINIKAFLYITTRNACLNHLRDSRSRKLRLQELAYVSERTENQLPLYSIIRKEQLSQVYTAMAHLPEKCRDVCQLAYVHGVENSLIAKMLRISVHTVKAHKANGINALRERCSHDRPLV